MLPLSSNGVVGAFRAAGIEGGRNLDVCTPLVKGRLAEVSACWAHARRPFCVLADLEQNARRKERMLNAPIAVIGHPPGSGNSAEIRPAKRPLRFIGFATTPSVAPLVEASTLILDDAPGNMIQLGKERVPSIAPLSKLIRQPPD